LKLCIQSTHPREYQLNTNTAVRTAGGWSGADTNYKNIHEYENHFSSTLDNRAMEKVHLAVSEMTHKKCFQEVH